ncbi:hypothetical protein PTQ27_09225 [Mannheimia sp. AT1]|uniref:Uncharacterized protein n=1 Tax=Mannheimia cairinae TaxID=3025936 RepID=A0ABT5MRN6_9PAST|nr:hypothetical protein [Mannheimia cairinae]MDD0824638.1 hypothetical protein [Mannheimia cairinae]MDD0826433.1 hypothetical protein [Mannheimia cairinae]
MEIKSFSYTKLIVDALILGAFIYSALFLSEPFVSVFIWMFWTFSCLTFLSVFTRPTFFFSKSREWQTLISELLISLVLVFFGFPVLATVGFISGFLYAGTRSMENKK